MNIDTGSSSIRSPSYLASYLHCIFTILRYSPKLTPAKISAAKLMLKDFTLLLPDLYDCKDCTLNANLLIHLCDNARHWGPIWGFSAFPFENKNRYLMGHVHSPHRIADQLLLSLHLNQKLDSLEDELLKTQPERALSFLGLNRQSNGHISFPSCYVVGSISMSKINREFDRESSDRRVSRLVPRYYIHFH